MFIYKITNKINGKVYVGQTVRSVDQRWKEHFRIRSQCSALKEAFKKYGKESFNIETIEICSSTENLNNREQYWINFYNCIIPNGYNLTSGGFNKKLTQEVKNKIRKAVTGANNGMYGKKLSEEEKQIRRERISKYNKDNAKPILCLELNKIFISQQFAARELNLQQANINKVLSGLRSHTGGYTFKYVEDQNG